MTKKKLTAKQKLLNSLQKRTLTTAQAQKRFGIINVSARISELRKDGANITTSVRYASNGRRSYSYTLQQTA